MSSRDESRNRDRRHDHYRDDRMDRSDRDRDRGGGFGGGGSNSSSNHYNRNHHTDEFRLERQSSGGDDARRHGRYDREYESRKFRDRRDRYFTDKYVRRSRDRDDGSSSSRTESKYRRGGDHRDRSPAAAAGGGGYSSGSRRQDSYEDRYAAKSSAREHSQNNDNSSNSSSNSSQSGDNNTSGDESRTESMRRQKNESEYLSKFSDEKLQETYERYENDPSFDITDGLLDNIVIDKEKVHREMQERLRQHLAAEGKVYPPPKPEPTQTMFANDGSFMEMFKKMQEQNAAASSAGPSKGTTAVAGTKTAATAAVPEKRPVPQPIYGKRRGGKILKTGIVEKKKPIEDLSADNGPTDAWSLYMKEVKRYKAVSCDQDNQNRPLVK